MAQKLIEGPNQYWSEELPPSRGQWRDIAELAARVFGLTPPRTRFEATVLQVRLRQAVTEQEPRELPNPW